MSANYKFEGWVGKDASSVQGNMEWMEFQPKTWEETDVDIKITHSGICATDLHVLRSGWGPSNYPLITGHEIVGTIVRAGSKVANGLKVGDVVGVSGLAESCLGRDGHCDECASHHENYCPKMTQTYNDTFRNGDKTYGGYALYHRAVSNFVVKVPSGIAPEVAAPMMCAGATVYAPLKEAGVGPGSKVGVVGIGGLGHFAILFAKAMGAEVTGISSKESKREDTLKLGADHFIATEGNEWAAKHARSLDVILSTTSSLTMPLNGYLSLLKFNTTLYQLGAPEGTLPFTPVPLIFGKKRIAGSIAASPVELKEMLQLAADKQIKPWVEVRPMAEANQAVIDMDKGNARFRYVLAN